MKKCAYLITGLLALFLYGCSGPEFMGLEGKPPTKAVKAVEEKKVNDYFDYLNPRFLDKTLSNIEYPSMLWAVLSKKDRVIVSPLDRFFNANTDEQLVVERNFIGKLVKEGYDVLDRSRENIFRSATEGSNGLLGYLLSDFKRDSLILAKNNLNFLSADVIFGYRVLEFGIVKINLPASKSVQRVGRASIEIRLVNAKTLKVLFTDIVNAKYEDNITSEIASAVKDFHYTFEDDALPFSQSKMGVEALTAKEVKQEVSAVSFGNSYPIYSKSGGVKIKFATNWWEEKMYIRKKLGEVITSFTVPSNTQSGNYEIMWDCMNNGELVPNGTYEVVRSGLKQNAILLFSFNLAD